MAAPARTPASTRPCAVCDRPLDGRTLGDTHRRCATSNRVPADSTLLRARPRAWETFRPATSLAALCAGAIGISQMYAPDLTGEFGAAGIGALTIGGLIHAARVDRWERARSAQDLWERLARVTGDAPGARHDHLRVRAYDARVPTDAHVRPGPAFDPAEEGALRAAMAANAGVELWQVRSGRGRGFIRLWLDETAERPAAPALPLPGLPEPNSLPAAPAADAPLNEASVCARVLEALRAAIDDDQADVHVLAWNGSVPRELVLTYPPRVAPRALEKRAELGDTMRALHRPDGDWFVHWDPERDRFEIADRPDPLAPHTPLPPVEQHLDCAAGPILGVGEDGLPWRQPLLGGHVLIAGASGSGKGSVLWGIVRGLTGLLADGRARLWVVDPKGGMEFGAARGFAHRFAVDEDEILELLAAAVDEMQANARGLAGAGSRKITEPTVERPLNVVLVDEIASVTAYMSDNTKRTRAAGLLSKLLSQGRAGGYVVVGALQDPRAEVLKVRNLFTFAIALALNEAPQVDMVLGRGVRARGAVCDAIPKSMPGVGFVVADGIAEPRRVRAAFVSDEEIDRLAAQLTLPNVV